MTVRKRDILAALGIIGVFVLIQGLFTSAVSYYAQQKLGITSLLLDGVEFTSAEINQMIQEKLPDFMETKMFFFLIADFLLLGIFVLDIVFKKKKLSKELYLAKFRPVVVAPLLLMGVGLNIVLNQIVSVIPFPESWVLSYENSVIPMNPDNCVFTMIFTVVVAPIVEEVVFRALAYTKLKRAMPTIVAAVLLSVIFGLIHGSLMQMVTIPFLGLVLVWVLERTKSLFAAILYHSVFNATAMWLTLNAETVSEHTLLVFVIGCIVLVVGAIWFLKIPMAYRKEEVLPRSLPEEETSQNAPKDIHICSFVLMILGCVFAYLFPVATFGLSIPSLVLGVKKQKEYNTSLTITLNLVALVVAMLMTALLSYVIITTVREWGAF